MASFFLIKILNVQRRFNIVRRFEKISGVATVPAVWEVANWYLTSSNRSKCWWCRLSIGFIMDDFAVTTHHHHHQSLKREGRLGTTDTFATSFLLTHFQINITGELTTISLLFGNWVHDAYERWPFMFLNSSFNSFADLRLCASMLPIRHHFEILKKGVILACNVDKNISLFLSYLLWFSLLCKSDYYYHYPTSLSLSFSFSLTLIFCASPRLFSIGVAFSARFLAIPRCDRRAISWGDGEGVAAVSRDRRSCRV